VVSSWASRTGRGVSYATGWGEGEEGERGVRMRRMVGDLELNLGVGVAMAREVPN
jgi:hypothetical protein